MAFKCAISAGHGPNTPGKRSPDGFKEFQFNYPCAEFVCNYLQEYQNVQVLKVYDPSRDVPLTERTRRANSWGADLYVSIHANASGSNWDSAHGIETLVYNTSTSNSNGYNVARKVQAEIIRVTGLRDRGIKVRPDLHEMRETSMPAFLVEAGFMTNQQERNLLAQTSYQQKVARAIVTAIAAHYGLKKKANAPAPTPVAPVNNPPSSSLYRVQIGAYASRASAEQLEKEAEAKGFNAYLIHEAGLYKVQVGAYSNFNNAKRQQDLAKSQGFRNAFIN